MRKTTAGIAALATVAAMALTTSTTAEASTSCRIRWGSLDKASVGRGPGPSPLVNVRAGRHLCYDRLVMDFRAGSSTVHVGYAPAVHTQGQGSVLPLRGAAFLDIALFTTTYDINTGAPTYDPANRSELVDVKGWRTFRQVADGGSFEGYTTVGLGVRSRLPFRVFSVAGPGARSRLVIDVAHHW